MTEILTLVLYTALLTGVALLAASLVRAKAWTWAGLKVALGNREQLPPATALAGRAERAARNTLEAFVLFAAIALVAHAAGVHDPIVGMGAQIFFWARVFYLPVYWAGIAVLRTLVWLVGMAGLGLMVAALF